MSWGIARSHPHMGCPPMIERLHFHRGYSLRLHKSKPFINYGIISVTTLCRPLSTRSEVREEPTPSPSRGEGVEPAVGRAPGATPERRGARRQQASHPCAWAQARRTDDRG